MFELKRKRQPICENENPIESKRIDTRTKSRRLATPLEVRVNRGVPKQQPKSSEHFTAESEQELI